MAIVMDERTKVKIISLEDLQKITQNLKKNPIPLGLDTETTGLRPRKDLMVALMFGTTRQVYILDMRPFHSASDEERHCWLEIIQDFLATVPVFIGHNLKFDWAFIYHTFHVELQSVIDTQLQEQVLYSVGLGGGDSGDEDDDDVERIEVGLGSVGERYGLPVSKDSQVWFVGLNLPRKFYANGTYAAFDEVKRKDHWFRADNTACPKEEQPSKKDSIARESDEQWYAPFPDEQIAYMAQDIVVPMSIYKQQQQALKEEGLDTIAAIENAALPAFASMECAGCPVDSERWRKVLSKKEVMRESMAEPLVEKFQPAFMRYAKGKNIRVTNEAFAMEMEAYIVARQKWDDAQQAYKNDCAKKYATLFINGKTTKKLAVYVKDEMDAWLLCHQAPVKPFANIPASCINLASPAQVGDVLQIMGYANLKYDRKTRTKKPSTSKSVLEKFLPDPLIADFFEWRKLDKFISSFGEKILSKIEADGRIHPEYNQIGAKTGRTSCKEPNWQQLPSHEPPESSVRMCVVAQSGNKLLTCDLPNIELRILADLSGEPRMLEAFAAGADLHSGTARLMFGLADDVDPDEVELRPGLTYRSVAKTINFGLAYGMSPEKLAASLKVDLDTAKNLFAKYRAMYKTAWDYLEKSGKDGVVYGYSKTKLGRKLFFNVPVMPERNNYDDWKSWDRAMWVYNNIKVPSIERRAKNAPIQGLNADIVKYAMIKIYRQLPKDCKLIACVHDEVVLEVPADKANAIAKLVSDCMTQACREVLTVVTIPQIGVEIAEYWKKGK